MGKADVLWEKAVGSHISSDTFRSDIATHIRHQPLDKSYKLALHKLKLPVQWLVSNSSYLDELRDSDLSLPPPPPVTELVILFILLRFDAFVGSLLSHTFPVLCKFYAKQASTRSAGSVIPGIVTATNSQIRNLTLLLFLDKSIQSIHINTS